MAFVLGLTFVVLVVSFRSVVVAATAVVLNLLSVGAAYGLLVLVFQHGLGQGLLDFRGNGTIVDWLPLFLFVVLFGLSMDYHVFVVSRIREAHATGMPTRAAVAQGVTSSAGVVTSAAAVMVGVFSIFGTLSLLEFKQLGVGLAAAVLIDATIVRAVLLPAAMTLLGRHNWWLPGLAGPEAAGSALTVTRHRVRPLPCGPDAVLRQALVAARKSAQKSVVVCSPAVNGSPTCVSTSSNGSAVPSVSTRKVSRDRPFCRPSSSPSGP